MRTPTRSSRSARSLTQGMVGWLLLVPGALVFLTLTLSACRQQPAGHPDADTYRILEGQTMGTYYRVTYADATGRDFQPEIDTLLQQLNDQVSTYVPSSTISRFNRAVDSFVLRATDTHFLMNFEKSREIFEKTGGAFDPTVMPLVNYWGFGYTGKEPVTVVDSAKVDSLLRLVGMDKIELLRRGEQIVLRKALPGVQLDFSAIAKGYGVDEVGRLLQQRGLQHYLVDIGGEVAAHGVNPKGLPWNIGINVPDENAPLDAVQTAVPLDNRAVATSGNYRNYYEINGVKYSHEINPRTGFPERNTLLSASVFAQDCMTADGYATACMILGVDRAFELAQQLPEIEVYLIYSDEQGRMKTRYSTELAPLFTKN